MAQGVGRLEAIDPLSSAMGDAGSAGAVQYQPPAIARWRADFNFIAVANDSWRRMELVRCASSYVRRRSFQAIFEDCSGLHRRETVRCREIAGRKGKHGGRVPF